MLFDRDCICRVSLINKELLSMKNLFDYKLFEEMIKKGGADYIDRAPYPYAVFDGLFDLSVLDEVNQEIDKQKFKTDERVHEGVQVKTRSDFRDNEDLPDVTKRIFEVINGGKFLNLVSELTSIKGLISDPYYDGGGINIIKNNGTLAVHVDGTTQDRMNVSRRINAIIFLSDNWDKEWNGYHEQWDFVNKKLSPFDDAQKWKCVRKILPKKGRLLIFTTNDHSWHGHAGVLRVPEGVERRSLITYYYTATRPDSDTCFDSPHRALFINNETTLTVDAYSHVDLVL